MAALPLPRLPRARRRARAQASAGPLILALAALALAALALASCGEPPSRPTGPVLVLDVKLAQPFEMRTILGATLLVDGNEVARFWQTLPESSVVFSRRVEGIAPGECEVAVRLDKQVASAEPVEYSAIGLATYAGRQYELPARGDPLADGQALRWRLALQGADATAGTASPD